MPSEGMLRGEILSSLSLSSCRGLRNSLLHTPLAARDDSRVDLSTLACAVTRIETIVRPVRVRIAVLRTVSYFYLPVPRFGYAPFPSIHMLLAWNT